MFKQDNTYKVQGAAWLGVSLAVTATVITTGSAWPLIALLIPLLVGGGGSSEKKEARE
jgi:hypothetical protein